jgi:hypothetical protein
MAAQSFEGHITYRYKMVSGSGKKGFYPIDEEQVFISNTKIAYRQVSGSIKSFNEMELLLDIVQAKAFEINHADFRVYELTIAAETEISNLENQPDEVVLGRSCRKKVFKRFSPFDGDSITYHYWIDPTMSISNSKAFAKLQGHQSWLLMDGNLGGIPIRYELSWPDGKKLSAEATDIVPGKLLDGLFVVPDYPRDKKIVKF